jgi:hypothetical protein
MLQNSRSITTRTNPPLSPAEREQRYQQVLREFRDPKFCVREARSRGSKMEGIIWREAASPWQALEELDAADDRTHPT